MITKKLFCENPYLKNSNSRIHRVISAEDNFTIILNSRASYEMQQKTYEHKMRHLKNGDLDREIDVNVIEKIRR